MQAVTNTRLSACNRIKNFWFEFEVFQRLMSMYTIKDLETLSGIKAHTIRIWEKRYGLLEPERTSTNIRFYTDEELRHLLNVASLVKHGHKISKVSGYTLQRIQEEVLTLSKQASRSTDFVDQLIIHILQFDTDKLEALLDTFQEKLGFERLVSDVIFPLFKKVGIYWQIGTLFPAQEHLVSNLVRQRIIVEISKLKPNGNKVGLFFLPENEMHELGMLFSQYLARKRNFKTIYLGQNVPRKDLIGIAGKVKVDFIVTAFVNAIENSDIEEQLTFLQKLFPACPIFCSGLQLEKHQTELSGWVKLITSRQTFINALSDLA